MTSMPALSAASIPAVESSITKHSSEETLPISLAEYKNRSGAGLPLLTCSRVKIDDSVKYGIIPATSKHNLTLALGDPDATHILNDDDDDDDDDDDRSANCLIVVDINGCNLALNRSIDPSICSLKNVGGNGFLNSSKKFC